MQNVLKKQIIIFSLLICSLQVSADQPPQTYQQFKAEFLNIPGKKLFDINTRTLNWVGIGTGVVTFSVGGYYLMNGESDKFQTTVLIGTAVYLAFLPIVLLNNEERPKGICNW
jgi:hypothetical protein